MIGSVEMIIMRDAVDSKLIDCREFSEICCSVDLISHPYFKLFE